MQGTAGHFAEAGYVPKDGLVNARPAAWETCYETGDTSGKHD